LTELIAELAFLAAKAGVQRLRPPRPRPRRGATLRPGPDTPLWLALAAQIQPRLQRRGARALLARELGLHRMRMTEYFFRRSAMPDAERTLELLLWLARTDADLRRARTPKSVLRT
jgi:hypothetical protein